MGLGARLVRRPNGTYSFRAWVPPELRGVIPGGRSGQKWIALGTADRAEAVRRARLKSVEFDRELATARRRLVGTEDSLSQAEAERLAAGWLLGQLHEDERKRERGVSAERFEEMLKASGQLGPEAARELATGSMDGVWHLVEDVLKANGLVALEGSRFILWHTHALV